MIYLRLAVSKNKNEHNAAAKERILGLQSDGRSKLLEISEKLESSELTIEHVVDTFAEFSDLARSYSKVPKVGREIKAKLTKSRNTKKYSALLKEQEASILLAMGEKNEKDQKVCCAFLVYEQTVKLAPAPSAAIAKERLDRMKQDKAIVASAKLCGKLQDCHKIYQRAEVLVKSDPVKATQLFSQILRQAPADTMIYQSARKQFFKLRKAKRS